MDTLARLRELNLARVHLFGHNLRDWSLLEWAGAMCGEAGEAANVAKKIRRVDSGCLVNVGDESRDGLVRHLGTEIAGMIVYGDLLAAAAGIDLAKAIEEEFDRVSKRVLFLEAFRAPEPDPANDSKRSTIELRICRSDLGGDAISRPDAGYRARRGEKDGAGNLLEWLADQIEDWEAYRHRGTISEISIERGGKRTTIFDRTSAINPQPPSPSVPSKGPDQSSSPFPSPDDVAANRDTGDSVRVDRFLSGVREQLRSSIRNGSVSARWFPQDLSRECLELAIAQIREAGWNVHVFDSQMDANVDGSFSVVISRPTKVQTTPTPNSNPLPVPSGGCADAASRRHRLV